MPADAPANPLLEPSLLPHALPPFALIRDEHYREAFDLGMAAHLAEVEAIATDPEPPTFENTLVALERSGQVLSRARLAFFGTSSSLATDAVQAIEEEYAPRLTAHEDAVRLDPRLYARIRAVHDDEAAMAALDPESRRLVERHLTEMTVAGAGLDESAKERLRELNGRLASLGTQFEKRLLADSTARTPERVMDLLGRLAPAAARNIEAERALLEEEAGAPIEAHDWAFWAERVRATRYAVDLAAMRPYFEAERVLRDGIFHAAELLYGLTFHERDDLEGYHPDVRVFEVHDVDGTPFGLYLLDLHTRDTKKGGAWMNSLVHQNTLLGQTSAVVCNNLNVPKPGPGEPTLLTYDETRTFFHEFGHAIHGLLARVTYPHFAGTRVFRDFVEYPSQVNEMWMLWPEVLANYAIHHESGERLPQELVDRLVAAQSFGEGFATGEYLAAALLDQAWHAIGVDEAEETTDVAAFEAAALAAVGLANPLVPPRYRSTYFAHTFSYAYDAQYYAYIWSEVLDADTVAWFRENGGLTRANGDHYRRHVVGIGGAADPLESYREFRGAEADIRHLLERRGLG